MSPPNLAHGLATATPIKPEVQDETLELSIRKSGNHLSVSHGDDEYHRHIQSHANGLLCIIDNGVRQRCQYHREGDSLYLQAFGQS